MCKFPYLWVAFLFSKIVWRPSDFSRNSESVVIETPKAVQEGIMEGENKLRGPKTSLTQEVKAVQTIQAAHSTELEALKRAVCDSGLAEGIFTRLLPGFHD